MVTMSLPVVTSGEKKTTPDAAEPGTSAKEVAETVDFVEEGAEPVPIASVSVVPKAESDETAKKDEDAEKKKEKAEPKTPSASSSQAAEVPFRDTQPVFEKAASGEMQKNWEALFSKEIAPDSIVYTVKSGDSLYVLAKKFHTTVDLIKKINGRDTDALYPNMKLKIYTAPFSILVNKGANTLILYANNKPVKQYSVATGKKNCTPSGTFKIANKLVNPTWFKTGAILPPGSPENALGSRWMGFDRPEYGIHGTIDPKSIGTQASQGCIRMLNADVEELYGMVPSGTSVTIQD